MITQIIDHCLIEKDNETLLSLFNNDQFIKLLKNEIAQKKIDKFQENFNTKKNEIIQELEKLKEIIQEEKNDGYQCIPTDEEESKPLVSKSVPVCMSPLQTLTELEYEAKLEEWNRFRTKAEEIVIKMNDVPFIIDLMKSDFDLASFKKPSIHNQLDELKEKVKELEDNQRFPSNIPTSPIRTSHIDPTFFTPWNFPSKGK